MLVAAVIMSTGAIQAKKPAILNRADEKAMKHWVNATFAQMTPDERIAQLIFQPYASPRFRKASSLTATERGAGGFGHTGR